MSTVELEHLLRAGAPAAPESLRLRVRELRAPGAERTSWRPFVPRRALLVAVPAVLALAVCAAVIRGVTSSAPDRRADAPAATVVHGLAPPKPAHAVEKVPYRAATDGSTMSSQVAPSLAGGARLERYEASLRLRVDGDEQLSRATAQATHIATALGGYAASVEYRTPAGRPGQSLLELRVPTARVHDALARLSALGTILSQRVSVQDLQRALERQSAQIAQLRETIRLTLAALRDPALPAVQRIQLQVKLAGAKRALAQRTHARKSTVAEGTLARVSLDLTTAKHAAVAPHHEGRLGRMLGSAASFLALEATVVLYGLVVLSPLLLLALLVRAGTWARRRRDEKRLLLAS